MNLSSSGFIFFKSLSNNIFKSFFNKYNRYFFKLFYENYGIWFELNKQFKSDSKIKVSDSSENKKNTILIFPLNSLSLDNIFIYFKKIPLL